MKDNGAAFGVDSTDSLDMGRVTSRGQNRYVRYGQRIGGLKVFGAEILVQVGPNGEVQSISSDITSNGAKGSPIPAVGPGDAIEMAFANVEARYGITDLEAEDGPELLIFSPGVLAMPGSDQLAWRISVAGVDAPWVKENVFVNAHSGVVVFRYPLVHATLDREVLDANNIAGSMGAIARGEGEPPTSDIGNPHTGGVAIADVDLAYDYFKDTYDFFLNEHGRDSLNDSGPTLRGTTRYCFASASCPLNNAFWTGSRMIFGEGLAAADDVVAHELTHGFPQFTSNLIYAGPSGALNESFSDVWGEFVDLTNGAGTDTPAVPTTVVSTATRVCRTSFVIC